MPRLTDFTQSRVGRYTRYAVEVQDIDGSSDYELVILGSKRTVHKAFGETDFSVDIRPHGTGEDWARLLEPQRKAELENLSRLVQLESFDDISAAMRPHNESAKLSAMISLRRLRGEGTLYAITIPYMFVGIGQSFGMVLPFVCTCMSVASPVLPGPGDVDLFLSLGFNPTFVRSSITRGSASEVVTFSQPCWPWNNFLPLFTIRGVTTTGVTSFFGGATVFP